jgi:hypothetical protein
MSEFTKTKSPIFFNIIETAFNCKCKECGIITSFENRVRCRYDTDNKVGYIFQCQCQKCGILKFFKYFFGPQYEANIISMEHCDCGGELRRDVPLFCKECKTEYWIER